MHSFTVKIDKRTKAGKAFISILENFKDSPGIEIYENGPYNPEFVARIKKAEANIKNNQTKEIDPNDIWGSLGIK